MPALKLIVGNKNYSSWSFRPWIAMKAAGIPFADEVIPFDFPGGNTAIKAVSPSGRVPVLVDGDLKVTESLAIIEYVAERYPDLPIWPADRADRALARSMSMEMATGFRALRNACPMNLRRPAKPIEAADTDDVRADVARIETLWHASIAKSGGPFLFGTFSAADAMYAPVVNRFETYGLVSNPVTLGYMAAMKNHPAWRAWEEAALAESWIVPEDEA